jgi:hypothetical protein
VEAVLAVLAVVVSTVVSTDVGGRGEAPAPTACNHAAFRAPRQ